jgi:shikimate kinase
MKRVDIDHDVSTNMSKTIRRRGRRNSTANIRWKAKVRATTHGAISVVNAIATGNGSALGISLKVTAEIGLAESIQGIRYLGGIREEHHQFINNIILKSLPKKVINSHGITVKINSEIPIGFGLKSSSAVSNAVSLACHTLVKDKRVDDNMVLKCAVEASLDSKVTITGAYDDSSASYFGGFVVTNNYQKKLVRQEKAPEDLLAIIFLPNCSIRGNIHDLHVMADLFSDAFKLAKVRKYWKAMKLNGLLTSAALSYEYLPIKSALQNGAISASISGNGPAIAAIGYRDKIENIKNALQRSSTDGRIIISAINNQKAITETLI